MKNRALWLVVVGGVGFLLVISAIARQHRSGTSQATAVAREEPVAEEPRPSFSGSNLHAPMPTRTAVPEPQVQEPAPQTQPATRAAPGRPVRAAKFKDAVADEQLTPQKVARVALSYVGADPAAELVWEAAINNPNFTPNERKDLIEDLNEEGFDDPKNLTVADLPLIVSRIQLIEHLAPQAADRTNAAAFAEAYKDLVNMYAKLTK